MAKQKHKVLPDREMQGRLRFPLSAENKKKALERSRTIAARMINALPSNYPKTSAGNIGVLYKSLSSELDHIRKSLSDINDDMFYTEVRPEYLYQVLGSMLFLGDKAVLNQGEDGEGGLNDVQYRDYLQKVKKGFFGGSRKDNLEVTLTAILGVPVNIQEVYLEARKPNSVYGLEDTHKLFFDIYMDTQTIGSPIGQLLQDLVFFIEMIRPAHTLYDTRLIWTDAFNHINTCLTDVFAASPEGVVYEYDLAPLTDTIYSLSRMSKYVGDPDDSDIVDNTWQSGLVDTIDYDMDIIVLIDGTILVISDLTLFYDQDAEGDFRIFLDDIDVGDAVKYEGVQATGQFKFYNVPEEIITNPFKQYDPVFIQTPIFQENVVKVYDEQGRFEVAEGLCDDTMFDQKVTDLLTPEYEDMRDFCDFPTPHIVSAYFLCDQTVAPDNTTPGVYNLPAFLQETDDPKVYLASPTPMITSEGEFASKEDVTLFVDGLVLDDGIDTIDPMSGEIALNFIPPTNCSIRVDYYYANRFPQLISYDYVAECGIEVGSMPGDIPACLATIPADGIVKRVKWHFPVESLDLNGDSLDYQMALFPLLDQEGLTAVAEDITVYVDGVEATGAVTSVRALYGHVRLNFLPPAGSTLTFEYYYQAQERAYGMLTDDIDYTTDTAFNSRSNYTVVMDAAVNPDTEKQAPIDLFGDILEIGYRYRAHNLSNTSVLNSEDTLDLNEIDKPATRASLANAGNIVSQYDTMFSPEHLTDLGKYLELTDDYLQNGLKANLSLRKGIPPFVKTFTDDTRFWNVLQITESESSFDSGTDGAGDLAASLNIVSWQHQSGLIEHSPLPDFRDQHRLLFYSDLKMFTESTGNDLPLTSLCDDRTLDFTSFYEEEYFPNRELRLNDYLDYVNRQIVGTTAEGELSALNGSALVKGIDATWKHVRIGGTISFSGYNYTVIKRINFNTLKLHQAFSGDTGTYTYSIVREEALQVDVLLNEVWRRITVDLDDLFGSTGHGAQTFYFPDPDPDPYPRNPDNPNLTTPASPLLTSDIDEEGGEVDHLLDAEEADKMVKFRNWDQDLIFLDQGLIEEVIDGALDDIGEGIHILFWNVDTQAYVKQTFYGAVIETSEEIGVTAASDYPNGLIRMADEFDLSELNEPTYLLRNTIIREIRPDNSVVITAIDEFVRV